MDAQQIEFSAPAGERLDKAVVAHVPSLSRVRVQTLIEDGHVTVNGGAVKAGVKLRGGETVRVTVPAEAPAELAAEPLPLNIVYEDDALLVVNKPAGMVVQPAVGNMRGTLVNALLARYPHLRDVERHGIVHRIDKETSGLLVVAKNERALRRLMRQFKARTVEKVYLALLEKAPRTLTGRVEAPIARDPRLRKKMTVRKEGKRAITEFEVTDQNFAEGQVLARVRILTGRTHQIRVHMAFVGAPVVGDTVYGYRRQRVKLNRLFLHAAELGFDHPASGERMHFEAPLPAELLRLLEQLRAAQ